MKSAAEFKAEAKAVMLEHLKSKGYPDMTTQQILDELKPLYVKLEEAKLIPAGMNFKTFVQIAREKAMHADFVGGFMKGGFRVHGL